MPTNRFEDLYEFYYPPGTEEAVERGKARQFLFEPVVERKAALRSSLTDDKQLWKMSVKKAIREAAGAGIQDRDWIQKASKSFYAQGVGLRRNIGKDERLRLKKATERGGMIKPGDVVLSDKQKAGLKSGQGYYLTPDQVKGQMLLEGNIPDDILEDFTLMSGKSIMKSGKIPEEYRIDMEERVKAPQYKPPSTREGPAEAGNSVGRFFADVGLGVLDVISAGGRFAQGLPAGYMKAGRKDAEIRAALGKDHAGLVSGNAILDVVGRLDDAIYGGVSSMFKLNDAPEIAEELGFIAHDYWKKSVKEAIDTRQPDDDREKIQARAKNIYQRRLKEDFNVASQFAIEHPGGTQLATEIIADPLNWIGVGLVKGAIVGTGRVAAKVTGLKWASQTATGQKVIAKAGEVAAAAPAYIRQRPGIKALRGAFYHTIDNDETIRGLGGFGDQIRRSVKAAEDAGGAASRKVRVIGGQIDEMLSKASEKKTLTWKVGDKTEEITESTALFRVLNKGEGIGNLPKKLQDVVPEVKKLSDELFDISARRGQLNKVIGGAVVTAGKVLNYVPNRIFEGVGDLAKRVQEVGFADINAAAMAVRVDTIRKRAAQMEKVIIAKQGQVATAVGKEKSALEGTIAGLQKRQAELNNEFARMNQLIGDSGGGIEGYIRKGRNLDKPTRALIHQMQLHADKVDIIGANGLHRLDPTSWAAVARKGGAKPVENAKLQWREHIKRESVAAGRAEEVSALTRMFGKELKDLQGGGLIHIKQSKGGAKLNEELAALSEQTGLHYSTLSPDLKRAYLQLVGKAGDPKIDSLQVILPKAMASRLNEIIPKLSDEGVDGAVTMFHQINEYLMKPANSIFRTSATVLRSFAFHATNMSGAVGLGMLAHGRKAFNKDLQMGAIRGAHAAAFAGDPKALGTAFRLADGSTVKIGELYKVMEQYGVVGQAGLRFGKDISAGKGWGATLAGGMQTIASKTRMQQVASFGDDYQHAVAFLGYMRRHGSMRPDDIYKALDFTTEYAGNYNRLTKFEKGALRDTFAFYSWNRFILPHLVKQVYKNPQRLAAFEKMRMAAEYQFGKDQPISGVGVPDFLRLSGAFQAPGMFQPGENNSGSHDVAMMMLETPLAALGALAPGYGGGSAIEAQLGPGGLGLVGMLTGFNTSRHQAYGAEEVIPSLDELKFGSMDHAAESLFSVADSQLGKQVVARMPFGEAMLNISKLYMRHGMVSEANEMWLRYRVGRDWMGLDHAVAAAGNLVGMNMEALSIPTYTPGMKLYAVDPYQTAKRRKARAVEGM